MGGEAGHPTSQEVKKTAPKKPPKRTRPRPAPTPPPSRLSDGLAAQLDRAVQTGRYLVAVYRIEGGLIHLDRTSKDFPTADHAQAVELLRKNLQAAA